ncbi:MAG: hypothetical protein E7584_03940 [Ruminococcaceae bacterium]|nr:hypothetical protein [Oscillospiraceae bacterium]
MKKKNRSVEYNASENIVGDKFDDTVWSLEAVTYKQTPEGTTRFASFGTGFLFSVKFGRYDRVFLVSNKHVLVEDNPYALFLHLPHTPTHPELRYLLYPTRDVSPVQDSLHDIVVAHDKVDLAIIDVSTKIYELQKALAFRNFKIKPLTIRDVQYSMDIEKGTPMSYLGFPDRSEYPRLKGGKIGLNPKFADDIVLDDVHVAQGASGSPAFIAGTSLSGEPRTKLLGVIYGTRATEIASGHMEYDLGHAVKVEHLKNLIYAALHMQGNSMKELKKVKWH